MHPSEPTSTTRPDQLAQVAREYADLFNANPLEDIDRLIADACIDPLWDSRTNLLSLLADEPEELGLVLANGPEEYLVVRFGEEWFVDHEPVDWDELEDQAFGSAPYDDGIG